MTILSNICSIMPVHTDKIRNHARYKSDHNTQPAYQNISIITIILLLQNYYDNYFSFSTIRFKVVVVTTTKNNNIIISVRYIRRQRLLLFFQSAVHKRIHLKIVLLRFYFIFRFPGFHGNISTDDCLLISKSERVDIKNLSMIECVTIQQLTLYSRIITHSVTVETATEIPKFSKFPTLSFSRNTTVDLSEEKPKISLYFFNSKWLIIMDTCFLLQFALFLLFH